MKVTKHKDTEEKLTNRNIFLTWICNNRYIFIVTGQDKTLFLSHCDQKQSLQNIQFQSVIYLKYGIIWIECGKRPRVCESHNLT